MSKKKRDDDEAIQDERTVKTKAGAAKKPRRDEGEDDGDDRSVKKKKGSGALLIGCIALVLVSCVVAVPIAGLAVFFLLAATPVEERIQPIAQNPDPIKDPDPEPIKMPDPIKDPEPKKEPDGLAPELERARKATVQISALLPNNKRSDGSGFFGVEPGLVFTNAHLLGMLDPNAPPPNEIKVTYTTNDGASASALANLVGVDSAADLAALRIDQPNVPSSLLFEDPSKIAEAQAINVFGYTTNQKGAKKCNYIPNTIATIRKSPDGNHEEMHVVNLSGVSPGGPMIGANGNVVGMASRNFSDPFKFPAVTVDVVKTFLDGKVGPGTIGKTVRGAKDAKVTVSYPLIDPLMKIQTARVEVWTGPAGAPRRASTKRPMGIPGDSPPMMQALNKANNVARQDVILPATIPPGQVVWLRPAVVNKDNKEYWGVATSVAAPAPVSPYQLVPANLTLNLTTPKERTAKLKYTLQMAGTTRGDAEILEVMDTDPVGASMKTAFGAINVNTDPDGKNTPVARPVLDQVVKIPTNYTLAKTGLIRKRTDRAFDNSVAQKAKDDALDQQFQITGALEATMVPMPNKTVKPDESWTTTHYVRVRAKKTEANLKLTVSSSYEGMLKKEDRNEAILTLIGKVTTDNADAKRWEGDLSGKIGFDPSVGFITSAQVKLSGTSYTLDIDLTRVSGNPSKIQLPQDKTPDPPVVVKGKVLVNAQANLTTGDLYDPQFSDLKNPKKKQFAHMKDFPVTMTVGKTYTITLDSKAFDAFLKIGAPTGMIVAQDDNAGGGTNARIVNFRPVVTGLYHVYAISKNHRTGAFHITIAENP
jgi:S1-C subfamily serine protease